MPAVQPPCKVLVTGANGFTGIWAVKHLLESGYSVRGAIRSAKKGEYLLHYFASYGEKFEISVVEDITKEGAFDESVKGVSAVLHTASPVHFDVRDPKELIDPAVQGTLGVLQSTLKYGPSVRRVVYTSSGSTVLREVTTPTVFTDNDWNIECLDAVKDQGENAPSSQKYRASKTLAEQAAWKFVEDHREEIHWDLTVLNPPYIFGPIIHEATRPLSLNASSQWFYDYVADPKKSALMGNDFLARTGSVWIDVRDLAEAFRLAIEKEDAGGERILLSAGVWKWQDFIDIANALDPQPKLSQPLPKGNRGTGTENANTVHLIHFDMTKAKRILGLKCRSKAETTRDIFADYETRGW
ncbi:hypothetical protein ID866_9311 [Astraeus odoratus]|nr:hypothetical protein ID866_9311 [Astraeus odoratus]